MKSGLAPSGCLNYNGGKKLTSKVQKIPKYFIIDFRNFILIPVDIDDVDSFYTSVKKSSDFWRIFGVTSCIFKHYVVPKVMRIANAYWFLIFTIFIEVFSWIMVVISLYFFWVYNFHIHGKNCSFGTNKQLDETTYLKLYFCS